MPILACLVFVPYWKGCFLRLACAVFYIRGKDAADEMETVAFGEQLSGEQRGWSPKSISLRLIIEGIKQFPQ